MQGACSDLGHVDDAALLADAALTQSTSAATALTVESTSTAAGQNSQKLARY